LLDIATEAIEAAELLVTNNYPDFAAGRAYYAMFYVAEVHCCKDNGELAMNVVDQGLDDGFTQLQSFTARANSITELAFDN